MAVLLSIIAHGLHAAEISVVLSADAPANERLAVKELADLLGRVYPNDQFVRSASLPRSGKAILLGHVSDALVNEHLDAGTPTIPESFVIKTRVTGDLELGIIAGADARGTVFGIYQMLSKLGHGFYLSGDTHPAPKRDAFAFTGWMLENAPLSRERLVFNWHNFLSGCSTWNLADWKQWTAQSQKSGFNAIMVHAYGNNPMAGFSFQDVAKPVGYLSSTAKGRDWSTMHVTDVREMVGGGVFTQPVFGADAAMVPDDQRVIAAQALMRDVFADAAQRDMGIYFAVDVDTPSANPQEFVTLLPESARFAVKGVSSPNSGQASARFWLPNPDTPEGYAIYQKEVAHLLKTYPQITRLVVWFRRDGTPWMSLKTDDFPPAWQKEYAAEIAKTPSAAKYWSAPGLFAIGKIVRAFQRALVDCQATHTEIAAGTWSFEFLPGADRFFPAGVALIGLDYNVLHGKPQLGDAASRAPLREIGARRPLIPVVWAHHDDGHYVGRPYRPLAEFSSSLVDAKASGFGIIHWTTRPLDLYFESLAKQVWQNTKDQALQTTCIDLAEHWYGKQNAQSMGNYLLSWINGAPGFGRETSDWFIDKKISDTGKIVEACHSRMDAIDKADTTGLLAEQRGRLDYQRGHEAFIAAFHESHGVFQASQELREKGDLKAAREIMSHCQPEKVIASFASFSALGGITRGEQGLVVSLNTRWLSHIVSHRQALGLEPVRINFAPTSHDDLAQFPGTFTYHFGPDQQLWQCLGTKETGAPVIALSPMAEAQHQTPLPIGWRDVCRYGINISKPITFTLAPIRTQAGKTPAKARPSLPAGDYVLKLLVLDPHSTVAGQRRFELKTTDRTLDQVDVFARTGRPNCILQLSYPITLKSAAALDLTLNPVTGETILCAAVLELKP